MKGREAIMHQSGRDSGHVTISTNNYITSLSKDYTSMNTCHLYFKCWVGVVIHSHVRCRVYSLTTPPPPQALCGDHTGSSRPGAVVLSLVPIEEPKKIKEKEKALNGCHFDHTHVVCSHSH